MLAKNSNFCFSTYVLLIFAFLFISPVPCLAVTRTMYFSQTGINKTKVGLPTAVNSYCRLTISNPSASSQTFNATIKIVATSTNGALSGNGTAAVTYGNGTPSSFGAPSSGVYTASSVSLASGASYVYTFTFPQYPSKSSVTSGTQKITCSGNIVASDTDPAAPGVILATGSMTVLVESSTVLTVGATGTSTFGGYGVFNQIPVSINRGKPF